MPRSEVVRGRGVCRCGSCLAVGGGRWHAGLLRTMALAGASDDASQVGVMLEAARAMVHRLDLPASPVVFLWTGGEEAISPVSAGQGGSAFQFPFFIYFLGAQVAASHAP